MSKNTFIQDNAGIVGRTYRNWWHGDPITDEELQITLDVITPMLEVTVALGDKFSLFQKELRKLQMDLESFKFHRALQKKEDRNAGVVGRD